jgi:hypothetical protein
MGFNLAFKVLKSGTTLRISIKFGMGVMLMVFSLQGNTALRKGRRKWAFGIAELSVCLCAFLECAFGGNRPILTKLGTIVTPLQDTKRPLFFLFVTVSDNKTADERTCVSGTTLAFIGFKLRNDMKRA